MPEKRSFDEIRALLAGGTAPVPPDLRSNEPPAPPVTDRLELPPAPRTVEETGLTDTFLENLCVKILLIRGEMTIRELCNHLHLPFPGVLETIIQHLRDELLVEIRGGKDITTVNLRMGLSREGTARAKEVYEREGYLGVAPVPLAEYIQKVREQPVQWSQVTAERMRAALGDVVVSDRTLGQLGPAFNSGRSMFLFGNPGNGKTLISERMANALHGTMLIPHAIEVGGQVIQYFDGSYHFPDSHAPAAATPRDGRWIIIRRPFIVVGGELKLEHLNLNFDSSLRYYVAPVQLKANGGVLMIDDFGRQQVGPRDLLNRWIVPLEKRVDYHTLPTGLQVAMPFEVLIIFSTNLEPRDLVDEAFLRRIRYKIEIGDPTEDQFRQIFRNACKQLGVPFDEAALNYLLDRHYQQENRPLRAVHPRDLLSQLIDIANYLGEPPRLTEELIDQAVATYFVEL